MSAQNNANSRSDHVTNKIDSFFLIAYIITPNLLFAILQHD